MAQLRNTGSVRTTTSGDKARAAEKNKSAALRAKTAKSRSRFNDQSMVDKLYRWVKSGIKSVESGFPAQTKGGTYTHQDPRD